MAQEFWHGIKDVDFIYHGDWADPEIRHNGMTVNSHIVEDTMVEQYKEYCDENSIDDDTYDGLSEYMLENQEEVKELIELAWSSQPRISATVDEKIGKIELLKGDVVRLNDGSDYFTTEEAGICNQPYIQEQFKKLDTTTLSNKAAEQWDLEEEFEGINMPRLAAIVLICKFITLDMKIT